VNSKKSRVIQRKIKRCFATGANPLLEVLFYLLLSNS